jgi:hypothetical protein
MRNTARFLFAIAFAAAAWQAACGAPKIEPKQYDGTSGATDLAPAPKPDAGPAMEAEAAAPTHVCAAPIAAPGEVWPRIEAIRALPAEEREERCGLEAVAALTAWRSVPVDLLAPIVAKAAADPAALDAWVADAAQSAPKAAADVVAMDVIAAIAVGGDARAAEARLAHWSGTAAAAAPEIATALEEAKLLPKLLAEVNAVHELRCLLEVNALGFAVKCTPIHPATTPISLNWTTAARDGLLERLELSTCEGKSCPKLRKTAEKLVVRYRALVEAVKKLGSPVYKERLFRLMELPPFKGRSAAE